MSLVSLVQLRLRCEQTCVSVWSLGDLWGALHSC